MYPSSGLLNSKVAPFLFEEETIARHLLVGGSWQEHVSIFVIIVLVLLRVLDLIWEMRHSNSKVSFKLSIILDYPNHSFWVLVFLVFWFWFGLAGSCGSCFVVRGS